MAREGPGEEGQRGGWQEPSTPCLESGSDFVLRTVGATAGLKKGMTRSYLCFTATSWLSTEEQRAAGGGEATKGLGHQWNGVWGGNYGAWTWVWWWSWPQEEQEGDWAARVQVAGGVAVSCVSFHYPTVNKEGRSRQGARVSSAPGAMPTG